MGNGTRLFCVIVGIALLGGCVSQKPSVEGLEPVPGENLDLRGFNLGAWDKLGLSARNPVNEAISFAAKEGASFLAIDWRVYFADDGGLAGSWDKDVPQENDLIAAIAKAKEAGMYVLLKPHVAGPSGGNRNNMDSDPRTFRASNFFRDWGAYLVSLAKSMEGQRADAICIGTELSFLDGASSREWHDLIASIRAVYPGELTYDAVFSVWDKWNFMKDVVFWDALDYVGCSVYLPVTADDSASVEQIKEGWRSNRIGDTPDIPSRLQAMGRRVGKKVMVLEAGYPSRSGGLLNPSDPPSRDSAVDNDLQARGLAAMLEVLYGNGGTWLKGISLWDLTPGLMGPDTVSDIWRTQGWSVYGKPAAQVVKGYFSR